MVSKLLAVTWSGKLGKKSLEPPRQICYIDNRKGKAREAAYPRQQRINLLQGQPSLLRIVAAISFPWKSDNTDPQGQQQIYKTE